MELKTFSDLLSQLGVVSFGADLAGGKIHWTNAAGEVVAHAKIKAILSWAATNHSAMWAFAIGQFQDAAVPCIKPENLKSDYLGNITDEQTAEFAAKAAEEAGASYLYRAANGANGLYLAIFDFKEESFELSAEDLVRKRRSAIGYVIQMLGNVGEVLDNKKRSEEAKNLLGHFATALQQQIDNVLKEADLIEETQRLQKSIQAWIAMLPDGRKDVLAFMKQAAAKWHRLL